MEYNINAHKTFYKDVMFRSRLEARWAAFFDLAGWPWEYDPVDLVGWSPDFKIDIPCLESCGGKHTALIAIKPYYDMDEFYHHPVAYYKYGKRRDDFPLDALHVDTVAGFGVNPDIAFLDITHIRLNLNEDSGGMYTPSELIPNALSKWKEAGNIIQYQYQWQLTVLSFTKKGRAMSIRIKIKPLSSNTCWQGRRFKNKKYKDFEKLLISLLPNSLKIPNDRKLEFKIEWGLSSKLADIDNFCKPFLDVLQKKFPSFNDKWVYKMTVQKQIVKKGEEYIEFQMEGYDEPS